jgi:hypothetical protein
MVPNQVAAPIIEMSERQSFGQVRTGGIFIKKLSSSLSLVYICEGYTIMLSLLPATVTCNSICLGHLGHSDINRNNPICVASPKVAKARTISVAVACVIAGVIT